jgi:hypothetical protein
VGTNSASVAAAERIVAFWPANIRASDIAALRGLPVGRAHWLLDTLTDTLPVGPLGATEAGRLEQLIAMFIVLDVTPSREVVNGLRTRYGRQAIPESVAQQLDRLDRMASDAAATPGVLGAESVPGVAVPPMGDDAISVSGGGGVAEFDEPRRRTRTPTSTQPTRAPDPPTPPTPPKPEAADDGDDAAAATEPPDRYFNADIEDHDLTQPLRVGDPYTVAFDIGLAPRQLTAGSPPLPQFNFPALGSDSPLRELTVQVSSQDFELLGDVTQRPLQLPEEGPSRGKARFDVSPRHTGTAVLTATVSYQGNFITQLELSCPVGGPGEFRATSLGRPVNSVVVLKPRDLGLVIRPLGNFGYLCSALGSVSCDAIMPVTADYLNVAANDARAALTAVVMDSYGGSPYFLSGIDIPVDVEQQVLRRLAEAGRRLYQKIFTPPEGGDDLARLGNWLSARVGDPRLQLTVQISANRVPVPWSMLYFGGVGPDDVLSWDRFLGVRHIVEQLPFQTMPDDDDPEIDSLPDLTLGLNINPAISGTAQPLVAQHQQSWADIAAARTNLSLVTRSTRADLLDALRTASTADKVMYFYCHAIADEDNPDESAIIMGALADRTSYATVGDLNLQAPTDTKLSGRPLIVLNACESAELSPRFYDGFIPYFLAKGARGVIGTECRTPVLFAIEWADAFVGKLLDGAQTGQALLDVRLEFLRDHRNPLGLLYTSYCDATTQIVPPVAAAEA